MIYILSDELVILAGSSHLDTRPFTPFSTEVCQMLADLSAKLRSTAEVKQYPDVFTFAFWCRRGNIQAMKAQFEYGPTRIGRGLSFHIAPSNAPVTFAYSLAFGLLAGNPTVVRIPGKKFPEIEVICDALNSCFSITNDKEHCATFALVRYEHDSNLNQELSKIASSRVIWGGDSTVAEFKKVHTSPRCVDIVFGDRTSLSVINTSAVERLPALGLERLAQGFFNDAYILDQQACSSPHLVAWIGEKCELGCERFWEALTGIVNKKYQLELVDAVDKYIQLCRDAIALDNVEPVEGYGTLVYRLKLNNLPDSVDDLKGKFGYFFEHEVGMLDSLADIITDRVQSMMYFGIEKNDLLEFVVSNRLTGIDRIVPIGDGLDLGVVWDGHDVLGMLSRIIDVR